ncbi:MAG: biotin/lipoyl-binding protein [Rhodobacteraceae bacterium]|nr:biotin/lipoyl-binding protein [Paracoccaceae bacterium]
MRFLWRSLTGLFLAGLTLGLLALAVYNVSSALQERIAREAPRPPVRERVIAASVVTVQPGAHAPQMVLFGEVRSTRSLDIRAPMGGTIVTLSEAFTDGGEVGQGDLLLALDPRDAESALALARADMAQAEAELRDARRTVGLAGDELTAARDQRDLRAQALARQENLRDRGVGSEASVEAAALALSSAEGAILSRRQALAQAEARVEMAETARARRAISLAEAERRLAETRITAEFGGVLEQVTALRGGLVANNERLGRLVDIDALEVVFRVSNAQFSRLMTPEARLIETQAEVRLDAFGVDVAAPARLVRTGGTGGEGATGRQVFAVIEGGRAAGLRPGDFVTVTVTEPELRGVALIPATALDSANNVLVLDAESRLREEPVEVLRRQGNDALIMAPALYGSQIVVERTPLVGAGIRIRPIRRGADASPEASAPEMVVLDEERRQRLIAFVTANGFMPEAVKSRIIEQLAAPEVPAEVIERLESRMGG